MSGGAEESSLERKVKERLEKDELAYRDFFQFWSMYERGKMGKHDLCCEIINIFSHCDADTGDLVSDLRQFYNRRSSPVDTAAASSAVA